MKSISNMKSLNELKSQRNLNKRWTEEEEQVVLDHLKNDPDNITLALKRAAYKINRTETAVISYWYSTLKDKTEEEIFATTSDNCHKKNGKNTMLKEERSSGDLMTAINAIFDLLSENQKQAFILDKLAIK